METILIGTAQGLYAKALDSSSPPELLGFGDRSFGTIRSIVSPHPEDPKDLYVSTTRAGVWRSEDGGATWSEANSGLVYKEVWTLARQPQTEELYAGTGPAGVFRSQDGGMSWEESEGVRSVDGRADWFLHLPPYFPHIRGLAVSDVDPAVIVCAVEEGGIIRTDDGGETWKNERDGIYADTHSVAIRPGESKIVMVATGDGMYRSTDGGSSFERCWSIDKSYTTHVLSNVEFPHVMFAVACDNQPRHWRTEKGAGTGFFLSYDSGDSWSPVTDGTPSFIHPGAYAASWDSVQNQTIVVGLTDGTIWRIDVSGSAEPWHTDLPTATSLAIVE